MIFASSSLEIPAKFAVVEVRCIGALNLIVNNQLSKDISEIIIKYGS